MGVVPAIYVYFQKASVGDLEVDYYGNFVGRSRQGLEVDHIPSKEAVRIYLKGRYPHLDNDTIEQMTDRVAAVAIPVEYTGNVVKPMVEETIVNLEQKTGN